jgi:aryl-phospho-beta-D-glucosidase BglC (GH1 family)
MDLLQVKDGAIVDAHGQPVRLRGTCVGGWMNMENFINGYPGAEHGQRAVMAEVLGPDKADYFFDRMLDYMLAEDDIAFLRSLGATVVRLPLNYRHFEDDSRPFTYLEPGFARLDRALQWCATHGLYAILDLHAVQGWQNTDWHSDNPSRHTLFWRQPHFQERFVALWEEFARRYSGNTAVAGYNVMNEPVTNAPLGRFSDQYRPDWEVMNRVYRRVVDAIRVIDPEHIIFLEGDYFSSRFQGLEAPFAPNLVYSSHNYTAAGFGPGAYPGTFRGEHWDRAQQRAHFAAHEGTQYTQQHHVPLWVGEFGSVYNGPAGERPDRLRALGDQIAVFEEFGAHWTTWTYKDVGVMGWTMLDPESEYMQRIAPLLEAKATLWTDFWMQWLPGTRALELVDDLATLAEETIGDPEIEHGANRRYLAQATGEYLGGLMQPAFARRFKDLSETDLDRILQAFALGNCKLNDGLLEVVRRHMGGGAS